MKIFFGIAFVCYAVAEIYITLKLKRRKQKVGVKVTAVSFSLFFILTFIIYLLNVNISYFIMLLAALSLFLDAYVGYYLNYYLKSRVVDRYLHAYGTFAMALLFYNLIILLTDKGGSKLFQTLFVLFLGIALGTVHEIVEFVTDSQLKSTMQKGLRDTNFDTIFNGLGSSAAAAAVFFFMTE